MYDGQYFIFVYGSDASYGGNPPWIWQLQKGKLETVFDPYDIDELGEFHDTPSIQVEALKFLKATGIDEVLTFNAEPNKKYFGTGLSDESEDNIDSFSCLDMDPEFKQKITQNGIRVKFLERSDLEKFCT